MSQRKGWAPHACQLSVLTWGAMGPGLGADGRCDLPLWRRRGARSHRRCANPFCLFCHAGVVRAALTSQMVLPDALATTLSAYLDLDATNPLSLFPGTARLRARYGVPDLDAGCIAWSGILEMLLILLEDSDCGEAAAGLFPLVLAQNVSATMALTFKVVLLAAACSAVLARLVLAGPEVRQVKPAVCLHGRCEMSRTDTACGRGARRC